MMAWRRSGYTERIDPLIQDGTYGRRDDAEIGNGLSYIHKNIQNVFPFTCLSMFTSFHTVLELMSMIISSNYILMN